MREGRAEFTALPGAPGGQPGGRAPPLRGQVMEEKGRWGSESSRSAATCGSRWRGAWGIGQCHHTAGAAQRRGQGLGVLLLYRQHQAARNTASRITQHEELSQLPSPPAGTTAKAQTLSALIAALLYEEMIASGAICPPAAPKPEDEEAHFCDPRADAPLVLAVTARSPCRLYPSLPLPTGLPAAIRPCAQAG